MRQVKKKNVNFPGHKDSKFCRSERLYQRTIFTHESPLKQWHGIGRAIRLSRFTINSEFVTLLIIQFSDKKIIVLFEHTKCNT